MTTPGDDSGTQTPTPPNQPRPDMTLTDELGMQIASEMKTIKGHIGQLHQRLTALEGQGQGPAAGGQGDTDNSLMAPRKFDDFTEWLDWLFVTYYLRETLLEELSTNTGLQEEFKALYVAYCSVIGEGKESFAWVRWHEAFASLQHRIKDISDRRRTATSALPGQN